MSRKSDLEQMIRESYGIIREYEQAIQTSDRPEESLRARREVERQWAHIAQYWQEYRPLAGRAVPPDVAEIAARVGGDVRPAPSPGSAVFDQRGQQVGTQINVAGDYVVRRDDEE